MRAMMLTLLLFLAPAATAAPPPGWSYIGAFRLPLATSRDDILKSYEYSGSLLAFHAEHGTLFASGHAQRDCIAEITIPTPSKADALDRIPRAEFVQGFEDVLGRVPTHPIIDRRLGGLLVHDGRLVGSEFSFYDQRAQVSESHFRLATTSLDSEVTGLFSVGPFSQRPRLDIVGGYMGHVPPSQQKDYGGPCLTGLAGLNIVSGTSFGPAVSVFDPATLGTSPFAPATPLVYYPENYPLDRWSASNTTLFNGTSQMRGVMMEDDGDILVWGSQGTGPWSYKGPTDARGYDTQAAPYRYQFWHYSKADLMSVKRGVKRPWQITPMIFDVTMPFQTGACHAGGMAYDQATGKVFVATVGCDDTMPIIHVYQVERDQTPPATDTNR